MGTLRTFRSLTATRRTLCAPHGIVLPASLRRRPGFGAAEQFRTQSIGGAKNTTTTKDTDAATLYENVLTIQNAADLQFPASNPANAGVRGQFLLGIFPPDHGGNHTPPPTPPAAPAK